MATKITSTSKKRTTKKASGKKTSKKRAVKAAPASKKKTARSSKKKPIRRQIEESSGSGRIPLKKICQQLDMDPKAARVKLRRLARNGELKFRDQDDEDHGSRWEFTPKQAEQIKEALNS